jgi:amino acid transporter
MKKPVTLRRSISLTMMTFYGLGTIIGAGIYVLVGKVAGEAGHFAPAAFLVAALLAAFTAFSYAELVSRYPRSAGEAMYVERAFNWPALARLVGLMIIIVGVVSTATLANGFVGYLGRFVELPAWLTISVLIIGLGMIAAWGIKASVGFAALLTVIEITGLMIVLWAARDVVFNLPVHMDMLVPDANALAWQGVLVGAFIAFYAFVGFEDMVNVAEEVKDASRTVPIAIVMVLIITSVLYVLVAMTAVAGMPLEQLAASEAPLADMYTHYSGEPATVIVIIGLLSLLNGILVQIIMATRVLYGMSAQGWLHDWFARVYVGTRTPLNATLVVTTIILIMAMALPLVTLAKLTSFVTLMVFTMMNLSLWRVKLLYKDHEGFTVPLIMPVMGALVSGSFVIYQIVQAVR